MNQAAFNQMVQSDIQRMMAPRKYTVAVQGLKNHRYNVEVLAYSEDEAIDRVLEQTSDDLSLLQCGEVAVQL
jgi:hypothetical protein